MNQIIPRKQLMKNCSGRQSLIIRQG